jgi:hypothetical protein
MGDEKAGSGKPFDPMDPFRDMRDVYLDSWAKAMVEAVNTEAYAQANGAMLDAYLTMSAPFRAAIEKAMLKALEQLSMPSRADLIGLAQRLTNIEMRLDDLDAKLDLIARFVAGAPKVAGTPAKTSAAPAKKSPSKSASAKALKKASKRKGTK